VSSLVILRESRRRKVTTDEQKRDVAATLGIGFIKLEFTEMEYLRTQISTQGFQAVTISVRQQGQRTVRVPSWSQSEDGRPCAKGELVFRPDELNRGIAYLPDSPFNRRKLASAISGKNALWHIVDDAIRSEVEELASVWEKDPEVIRALEYIEQVRTEVRVAKEEQKRQGEFGTSPIDSELLVYEQKIAELEKTQKLEELKQRYQKLIKSQGSTVVEESGIPSPEKPKTSLAEAVANRVKEEVYAEKADLIARLKADKPRGWARSSEYRQEIQPEIDRRIAEELGDANDARTDNASTR